MHKYIFDGMNPFNICAEEIIHLSSLDSEQFDSSDKRKSMVTPENLEKEVKEFFKKLPVCSDPSKLLRDGMPNAELRKLHEWTHYNDFSYLLDFLSRFTRNMPYEKILNSTYMKSLTWNPDRGTAEFESLNDNLEETGVLILPKVATINDPLNSGDVSETAGAEKSQKHWAADRMAGIQNNLSNVYYVMKTQLKVSKLNFQVRNSVLDRNVFPEKKKTWKIAACPVGHQEFLKAKTSIQKVKNGQQGLFSITGLQNEELLYKRIKADLLAAARQGADMIMFPEMLGDTHVLSKEFFDETGKLLEDYGYPMPKMMLAPTVWHDCRNELYVFAGAGKLQCIQQKQYPYLYPAEDGLNYLENLQQIDRTVHVVHIPEVGRFMFAVCRDYLEEDYIQMMLQTLHATFILCPSFSPHKTQFELAASKGNQYGCYTVWLNTCAAYFGRKVPQSIGFASGPQGDLRKAMENMIPECDGNCGNDNESCIFMVEISMDDKTDITCKHIRG